MEEMLDGAYDALEGGDVDAAGRVVAQLLERFPGQAQVVTLQADVLLAQDLADEALEVLNDGIERCDDRANLLAVRGGLLLDVFDDPLGALEDLDQAVKRGARDEMLGDVQIARAEALLELQQPQAALAAAKEAGRILPTAPEPHHLEALAHYDLHQFEEAARAVGRTLDREPRFAAAYFIRGEILAAQGREEEAARAFGRAQTLDPEQFKPPISVSPEEFEQIVADALDSLPEQVAAYLRNTAVVVDPRPDLALLRRSSPPLSPSCLGMFDGTPRPQESTEDPWSTFPKTVHLFRDNIVRGCSDHDELVEAISTTLLHEIGHFLGLDEDDLVERGLQ